MILGVNVMAHFLVLAHPGCRKMVIVAVYKTELHS